MLQELSHDELDDVFGGASGMMSLSVTSGSSAHPSPDLMQNCFGTLGTAGTSGGGTLGSAGTFGSGNSSVSLCMGTK